MAADTGVEAMTADTQRAADVARDRAIAERYVSHADNITQLASELAAAEDRGRLREREAWISPEFGSPMGNLNMAINEVLDWWDAGDPRAGAGCRRALRDAFKAIRARTAPQPAAPQGGTKQTT